LDARKTGRSRQSSVTLAPSKSALLRRSLLLFLPKREAKGFVFSPSFTRTVPQKTFCLLSFSSVPWRLSQGKASLLLDLLDLEAAAFSWVSIRLSFSFGKRESLVNVLLVRGSAKSAKELFARQERKTARRFEAFSLQGAKSFGRHAKILLLSSLVHGRRKESWQVMVPQILGEGWGAVPQRHDVLAEIVCEGAFEPGSWMSVFYLGAIDSRPRFFVFDDLWKKVAEGEMERLEEGVFKATFFTPPSTLLVLRVEDDAYKISTVKVLERAAGVERLCVDAFYDQKLEKLSGVVWLERNGWLVPFEEEDVVFVEVRNHHQSLSMTNLRGFGSEFLTFSEDLEPQSVFVVTASFKGLKAVKVLAVGGAEKEENAFVLL